MGKDDGIMGKMENLLSKHNLIETRADRATEEMENPLKYIYCEL